jgi:hypothetical protein
MKKTLILLAVLALGAAQALAAGITIPATIQADLVTETNRAQVAEAALGTRITTETNRAQVAEAVLTTASTNRYTKAESDGRFATTAQGVAATNAQTLVTTGNDPGHGHTAYSTKPQTNAADVADFSVFVPAYIGQLLVETGNSDGTNNIWIAVGLATNSWNQLK